MSDKLAALRHQLIAVHDEALGFFESVEPTFEPPPPHLFGLKKYPLGESIPPEEQSRGANLAHRLRQVMAEISSIVKSSPLSDEADLRDLGRHTKTMAAAIHFRSYRYQGVYIHHDEDIVLGVDPPTQWEEDLPSVNDARLLFVEAYRKTLDILDLASAQGTDLTLATRLRSNDPVLSYRKNTAFIMMWMAKDRPELTDVSNSVKKCFADFGIDAKRSDDIEHEDVITQRILDQIKTAEFLFADLTGERPSVYYEVGYAHALGRRVILFRKTGTSIHFDLAAYNCPEYQNMTELEEQLRKRLGYVTGRVVKKNV